MVYLLKMVIFHCYVSSPEGIIYQLGESPFLMGKSTVSMAMFNSYVSLPEGKENLAVRGIAYPIAKLLLSKFAGIEEA